MRNRIIFYLFIATLIVLDSVLLRSPSLLGKIGLIIYKYHYLRTFPKTLMTVTIVVGVAVVVAELIRWLRKRRVIKKVIAILILLFLVIGCVAILIKTGMDFSTWTYSHTGIRFRYGAYLLPVILMIVFIYALFTLPTPHTPFPLSGVMEEKNKE